MQNDKWSFFQLPDKKALNAEEVRYWKNNMNKILKAGLEFEFNLPNTKGKCKGVSSYCPCVKFRHNSCWEECIRTEDCKKEFGDTFEEKCSGVSCVGFIMACATCDDFELDCEKCTHRYDLNTDPDNIRRQLRDSFKPSLTYGQINSSGVYRVVGDGSLLGAGDEGKGAEVITTGRRVDYWEFFNMSDIIIKKAVEKGAYVNERCSIHVHLLASYYDKRQGLGRKGGSISTSISELEKPLPQLILSNFHQLCRRYQNAITWMCCGLDEHERLTRWEKYRVSILDVSPVRMDMDQIIHHMEEKSQKKRGKYGWVNYKFTRFDDDNNLTRLHVEMRALDGIMSASAVTALTCMYYALVIKAIEISRYGLLEVGSQEWMEQSVKVKDRLMNNTSGWQEGDRFSDTSKLTNQDIEFLQLEATDLNNQLKHILLKIGPAYDVLESLANKPIAIRRCEGQNWDQIESDLAVYQPKEVKYEKVLSEHIDMRSFVKCENEKEWCVNVFSAISKDEGTDLTAQLNNILEDNKNDGEYIWSGNLGTMLKV